MELSIQVLLTLSTSFVVCFFSIPSIIKVAEIKYLFDEPCSRKQHKKSTPTLGGISIFAGFIFSTTFWSNQSQIIELQYIIAALMIMFFLGIKDDIVNLVAHKKLIGQIFAAAILVFMADIRVTSLYGIFNIFNIPYTASVFISIFIIIGITNSINLIDGIDTLAGSVGLLSALVFGSWFFKVGFEQYAILSAAIIGSLSAFLFFNKTPAKIFMGDTGSLIVGIICSILAIKFIEFNKSYVGPQEFRIFSVPAVAISVLIIPVFDTLRVFLLRILQGRSPLSADRNHIHHILIDRGYSHIKATLLLISLNIVIISFAFTFQKLTGELILFISFLIILSFSIYHTRRRKIERKAKAA